MIHVVATIDLKPGCRERFLAAFHELVPQVRREAGCIHYIPTVDHSSPIERQAAPRPNTVVVIEAWDDVPALQAHLSAPHMATYREQVKDWVAGTELRILSEA